jgi:hypothetical protein
MGMLSIRLIAVPVEQHCTMSVSDELIGVLENRVRIDTRALAFFRILSGILIMGDALSRSRNLHYFYTRHGAVSVELAKKAVLARSGTSDYAFSVFYYLPNSTEVVVGLFILYFLFGLWLALGYKTRYAVVASLILVVSFDYRNYFAISHADILFSLLLFWSVFLPIGERWSLDAVRSETKPRETVSGLATVFILLQMVFMYSVNGVHKHHSDLWNSGEVIFVVIDSDELTFLLGDAVRQLPNILLQSGALFWYYLFLISPLLLVLTNWRRSMLSLLFVFGHASLAVTVRIGAFSYVAIAGVALFLHKGFWDAILNYPQKESITEKFSPTMRKVDAFLDRAESHASFANKKPESKKQTQVIRRTTSYLSILCVVVLLVAGGSMIATNLQTAGQSAGIINETVDEQPYSVNISAQYQGYVQQTLASFHLDQPDWRIFAPRPGRTDHYYVLAAETKQGNRFDVFNNRTLSFKRPYENLNRPYDTYRERFYMYAIRDSYIWGRNSASPEVEMMNYYCEHPRMPRNESIEIINMYAVTEKIKSDGIDNRSARKTNARLLLRHTCSDDREIDAIQTPPTLFSPFDGGYSPQTIEVNESLELESIEPESMDACSVTPSPFGLVDIREYVKLAEAANHPNFNSETNSLGIRITNVQRYNNGYLVDYEGRVYTKRTSPRSPIYYFGTYTVTSGYSYRRVYSELGISEEYSNILTRPIHCFNQDNR